MVNHGGVSVCVEQWDSTGNKEDKGALLKLNKIAEVTMLLCYCEFNKMAWQKNSNRRYSG